MPYEFDPLTDTERQRLTIARYQLDNFSKDGKHHNWSESYVDYVQELMMRDWLSKKKQTRINEIRRVKVYQPPERKYDGKFDFKEFVNSGNEIKNVS